jgi:hypothetical protein
MSASLRERANFLTFERFATALLFVGLILAACMMPAQTDTWWQLRAGESMWHSGRVMLRDEFSHTVSGAYWPNHEWLAQVAFYAAYKAGGLPMLTALCAAAVTLAWTIIARLTTGPRFARLVLLGAGAVFSSPAWSIRPQVFSLALFAVTMWIIVRQRWTSMLLPLFVLWANLHGGVAHGVVLLLAATVATLVSQPKRLRRMAILATACILCTAATPLGFTLWREIPLSLARLRVYNVMEWQRPGLALMDLPFWVTAVSVLALLFINRSRLRTSWTIAFLGIASLTFLALAVQTRRNVPPFIMCAVPLLGSLLPRRDRTTGAARIERPLLNTLALSAASIAAIVFVAAAWRAPVPRLGWQPVSAQLRNAITSCQGRLYNRYDDGGYLIWFARDKKVFIDSRQDPYPQDIVRRHIELESTGDYQQLFARYDIGCALTPKESTLATRLARDGWRASSGDGSWAVYAKPPAPATVADRAARPLEAE